MENNMKKMLEELQKISAEYDIILEKTGAKQRYNQIKQEILQDGWNEVYKRYIPENNPDDLAKYEMFEFVKFAYDCMKRKGEVNF